jgi:hypothetical protein
VSPKTPTLPPSEPALCGRPRLVPPPVDSEHHWRELLNLLYLHEQDALFEWLRTVRVAVEEAEKEKQRRAA